METIFVFLSLGAAICSKTITENVTLDTASSSVFGNRSDGIFCFVLKKVWGVIQNAEPQVNHQLQQTVRKAYLEATRNLCYAHLQILGVPCRWRERHWRVAILPSREIRWLDKAIREINGELKQVDRAKYVPPSQKVEREMMQLMQPTGQTLEQRRKALFDRLQRAVVEEFSDRCGTPPTSRFKEMVCQGWYENGLHMEWFYYFSKSFESQLNTNPLLCQIIDDRFLGELRSQNIPVTLSTFKRQFQEFSERIDKRFDKVDNTLLKIEKISTTILQQVSQNSSLPASNSTPATLPPSTAAKVPPNPFTIIPGPIANFDDLLGRQELLRQIFEELAKGVSLSLVGPEKVGKSSLLQVICQEGPNRLKLPEEHFIYLDMSVIHNEAQFFEALCEKLGFSQPRRGLYLNRELIGQRYVLCLDEIQKLVRTEHFSGDESIELQGLANGMDKPFRLVVASQRPLKELFPDSSFRTSPLAGFCQQIEVKPFSTISDVGHFLNSRLQPTGITFSEAQIMELLEKSQGYPAHLQREAADLYDRLIAG